jgi:RNA polymerase sigma factor (sigma-70 family)
MMTDDMELVREYAAHRSEPVFETLVARHVNLVYSTALRQVGNPHLAEEITQVVFIILARKAGSLGPKTILPSWLHRAACFVAADTLKVQRRRARREQEAHMQSLLNEPSPGKDDAWPQIAPLLDTAIAGLSEKDRHVIVLRFFEKRSLADVSRALGTNEDAVRMRVNRALEKLRRYFFKCGVSSTTAIIAGAISAHSVQAAPTVLAKSATAVAIAKGGAAGGSTLTLIKGALKLMAWTKAKTAIVVGAAVVLAAGTTTPIVVHHYRANASIFTSTKELSDSDNANYETLTGTTPEQVARAFFEACSQEDWTEAAKYWWSDPRKKNSDASIPDGFKQHYGGLEIISIGKPFKARISIAKFIELQPESRNQFKGRSLNGDFAASSVFVPYEMRLKDGTIRKWQLNVSCDNPDHRWYYNGGM